MSQYPSQGRPGLRISVILFLLVFWGALLICGARNVQEAQVIQRFRRDQLSSLTHQSAQKGAEALSAWLDGLQFTVRESLLREEASFPKEVEAVWIWSGNLEGPPEQSIFPGVSLKPVSPDLESQIQERLRESSEAPAFWTEAGLILSAVLPSGKRLAFLVGPAPALTPSKEGLRFALVDAQGRVREHSLKTMEGTRVDLQGAPVRSLRTLEGKEAIEAIYAVPKYPIVFRTEALIRPVYRKVLGWTDFFVSVAFALSGLMFLNLGRALLRRQAPAAASAVELPSQEVAAEIRVTPELTDALSLISTQQVERESQQVRKEQVIHALPKSDLPTPEEIRKRLRALSVKVRSPFLHLVWSRESQALELNFQAGLSPALELQELKIPLAESVLEQWLTRHPQEQGAFLQEYRPLSRELLSRMGAVQYLAWPFPEELRIGEERGWLILLNPETDSGLNLRSLLEMLVATEIDHAQDPPREAPPNHPTESPSPRGE